MSFEDQDSFTVTMSSDLFTPENICSNEAYRPGTLWLVLSAVSVAVGLISNVVVAFVCVAYRGYSKNSPRWFLVQLVITNAIHLALYILNIAENLIGRWPIGITFCKLHKLAVNASVYAAVLLLLVTNIERTATYTGSRLRSIFSFCTAKYHRIITSLFVWSLCLCASIPHYQKAEIEVCQKCSLIQTLSQEEICQHLKLNATSCDELFNVYLLSNMESQPAAAWKNGDDDDGNYMLIADEDFYDYLSIPLLGSTNASQEFPCRHDEPPRFHTEIILRFVILFLLPLLTMVTSALSYKRCGTHRVSTVNTLGDSAPDRWMIIVIACNVLFIMVRLPHHVISLTKISGINAGSKTCHELNQFSAFFLLIYYALFPIPYMCFARNFKQQLVISFASAAYCVAEKASIPGDFITMRNATSRGQVSRDTLEDGNHTAEDDKSSLRK